MKIVIQCCSSKRASRGEGRLRDSTGKEVLFVADPNLCEHNDGCNLVKPDDQKEGGPETWRRSLERYNQEAANPDGLFSAVDLYAPRAYEKLSRYAGRENVFILSAGWGLVRGTYRLPDYNITFSKQADKGFRRGSLPFQDFNHLLEDAGRPDDEIVFFGGKDYRPLFYRLVSSIAARKVVVFPKGDVERVKGFEYVEYPRKFTNWHYVCVGDFVEGRLPLT